MIELWCPYCGRRVTVEWSAMAFPGAAYVCTGCGRPSVVRLMLGEPTGEELTVIGADPVVAAMLTARTAIATELVRVAMTE